MDIDLQTLGDPSQHFGDLYVLKQPLGKGSFGRVMRCINKETELECAVKIINKTELTMDLEAATREVQILASLDHSNVVRFQGIHHNKHHVFIQMELLKGGTLAQLLKRRSLSDAEAAVILRGILGAVSYLHSRDILHRDLKPDNVMFLNDDLSSVKIADFGLSAKFGQHIFAKTFEDMCGTVAFMAPEQIMHRNYAKPVDIWSCAIMLFMAITGKHPLLSQGDTVAEYTQKLQNPMWEFSSDFNPLARQLFLHMTNMQPLERYTADQALRHPWITREETEIPKTYLERIADYNAISQLKRLVSALVGAGALLYLQHGKKPLYEASSLPVPSISEPLPVASAALPARKPSLSPSAVSPSYLHSLQHRNTVKFDSVRRNDFRRRSTDLVSIGFAHRSPARDLDKYTHSPAPLKSSTTLRPTYSSYLRKPRLSPTVDRKSG